jgi:hypothetical protein
MSAQIENQTYDTDRVWFAGIYHRRDIVCQIPTTAHSRSGEFAQNQNQNQIKVDLVHAVGEATGAVFHLTKGTAIT